jgi:hypothetical protein
MDELKSSRFLKSGNVILSIIHFFNRVSKHEMGVDDSVVSCLSGSVGFTTCNVKLSYELKELLLTGKNPSSINIHC